MLAPTPRSEYTYSQYLQVGSIAKQAMQLTVSRRPPQFDSATTCETMAATTMANVFILNQHRTYTTHQPSTVETRRSSYNFFDGSGNFPRCVENFIDRRKKDTQTKQEKSRKHKPTNGQTEKKGKQTKQSNLETEIVPCSGFSRSVGSCASAPGFANIEISFSFQSSI